jgi:hypothetical protein
MKEIIIVIQRLTFEFAVSKAKQITMLFYIYNLLLIKLFLWLC